MSVTVIPHRYDPDPGPAYTGQPQAQGWIDAAWNTVTGTITIAALAALITGLTVYALMRRPTKTDLGKRLMYVPLLLVNGAAVYGQVAFFYENVARDAWPTAGKIAVALVIALGIESIAVYVGWHAHDALLNKAGNTAARLRRASYVIASIVAGINYAHFAEFDGSPLGINAAALAFGLLSLISPWLWGLHSRRAKNVQLRKEGVVDATGAVFSGERVRSFPIRSYLARRWSIDHYITDPRAAWEGYNAELRARWAVESTDQPGWWLRINPAARVRQLTAATTELQALTDRQAAEITDWEARLTDTMQALAAAHQELGDVTAQLDEVNRERLTADTSLRELTDQATADREALIADAARERADLIARHEAEKATITARLTADGEAALAKQAKELTAEFNEKLAAAKLANLADRRTDTGRSDSPKTSKPAASRTSSPSANKPVLTDEEAVQAMLKTHRDPGHEWSDYAVRKATGAGYGSRIPRLIAAWREAAIAKAADDISGEVPRDDSGEPMVVNQ